MFKDIVVAFDGSNHAETAVLSACDMADKYSAKLHLIHVPEAQDQAIAMGASAVVLPVDAQTLKERGTPVIKRATDLAKGAGQVFSSTEILSGPPADAILKNAKDKGADLIISGRRGHGQLKGMLMGSVSQKIASSANCAVMTVM